MPMSIRQALAFPKSPEDFSEQEIASALERVRLLWLAALLRLNCELGPPDLTLRLSELTVLGLDDVVDAACPRALVQIGNVSNHEVHSVFMIQVNAALSGGQFQKLMVALRSVSDLTHIPTEIRGIKAHCLLVKPAFILLDE